MTDKQQLRSLLKAKREQLSDGYRQRADRAIFEKLLKNSRVKNAKVVMTYVSMGSEADTIRLIEGLLAEGKRVAVPVVAGKELEVSYITSLNELAPGRFGIFEPKEQFFKRCSPMDIDVVIVPGIAFDKKGHRIGYGAGYYDRFLPRTRAFKIGICHDECIVDDTFAQPHDIAVDYIITDLRDIY